MTLERISTGVATLDALIEGGIPRGFTVLVAGNPGTGKTILTTHFLYAGLSRGEAGVYVSFSESKNQFYDNFERFGMKFLDFEKDNKFAFLDFASVNKDGIADALQEVLDISRRLGAKRVVIDSFSAILLAFDNINEARIALHVVLGKMLRSEGITNMLIAEVPVGTHSIGSGMEEFVADGIIQLEHGPTDAVPATLKVVKMRATSMSREPHVCIIGEKGMIVYPKQALKMIFPVSTDRIKTGISGLDRRVQGGLLKGTTTILAGASGTGKTTFGFQFATQGVLDGESSIFCSLEESPVEIRSMAQSLGFDVSELEKKGLHLLSWIPENQSPDAFISALASQIEAVKPSRIVLDGLSTFEHLYSQEMYLIAKRLVNLIHTHGITSIFTILTDQQSGLNITSFGLSSIFHNIILLRYVEADAQLKRSMLILKMRASSHDQSILQFSILSKAGLKILGTMSEYQGIMSGIAQKVYQKYLNKEQKIVAKQIAEKEKRNARLKAQQKRIIEKEEHARLHRRRKRV
jgi:circadian clock protein KaiC